MPQQISVVTLGVADLAASRRFYAEGFGWTPVFENPEIIFYQMNGLMLGTWLRRPMQEDMRREDGPSPPAAVAFGHNVGSAGEVEAVMRRLASEGGRILRPGDAPPHGGYRGYVEDPDGNAWEIAWNPAWAIDAEGRVTFGV